MKHDHPCISGSAMASLPKRHSERGAVLVVALIFLVLLTILALTASSSSMMQLRMAGNLRSAHQAEMAANSALRAAEWALWVNATQFRNFNCDENDFNATTGCVEYNATNAVTYGPTGKVTQFREPVGSVGAVGREYLGRDGMGFTDTNAALDESAYLDTNPRYIIEKLGKVTAGGGGGAIEHSGAEGSSTDPTGIWSYRITVRAAGGSPNAVRILQGVFDARADNS